MFNIVKDRRLNIDFLRNIEEHYARIIVQLQEMQKPGKSMFKNESESRMRKRNGYFSAAKNFSMVKKKKKEKERKKNQEKKSIGGKSRSSFYFIISIVYFNTQKYLFFLETTFS